MTSTIVCSVCIEPGWRLVRPGETLRNGEERLCAGSWGPMLGCLGLIHNPLFFPVRRKK